MHPTPLSWVISEQQDCILMLCIAISSEELHPAQLIWELEKVLYIPEGSDTQFWLDLAVEATEITSPKHYVNILVCEQ